MLKENHIVGCSHIVVEFEVHAFFYLTWSISIAFWFIEAIVLVEIGDYDQLQDV